MFTQRCGHEHTHVYIHDWAWKALMRTYTCRLRCTHTSMHGQTHIYRSGFHTCMGSLLLRVCANVSMISLVCTYTCEHGFMHLCTYTCGHVHTFWIYICACDHAHVYIHVWAGMRLCAHTQLFMNILKHTYEHGHKWTRLSIDMRIGMIAVMCIFTYGLAVLMHTLPRGYYCACS